jgi:hypothetical protein
VLLVRTSDYTATNGTSVVLASAAIASDTLVVVAYGAFNVANTYTQAEADARYPLNSINFVAGKNKIINGDFGVWQRGTSFSNPGDSGYTADRWVVEHDGTGATRTVSQQTFTPGTAPVAGYEGQFFLRYAVTVVGTGNTFQDINQRIEDVRTFAGQTVTFSFWAKSAAASTVSILARQAGLSGADTQTTIGTASVTTSWQRFSYTTTLTSVAGKTIAANSVLQMRFRPTAATAITLDIWGVQLEAGSVATAFQTATGTIQGELAACQRYYYRSSDSSTNYAPFVSAAISSSSTQADCYVPLPVTMRTKLASVDFANLSIFDYVAASGYAISNVVINSNSSPTMAVVSITFSTATAGRFIIVRGNNSSSAYLGFSAEL